ncbi:hypothetical protein [Neorhizobium sp. T25_27]|uniref:hypothetical protein n=1 Tax=Neorhizobium sp. T25_27 TaxID=2093831 RepID=UPI00155E5ED0|nr:hypothetical protein [Neorhizobium sp. T25_27]
MPDTAVVLLKQFFDNVFDIFWPNSEHVRALMSEKPLFTNHEDKGNRSRFKLLGYPKHEIGILRGIDQHAMGSPYETHFESRRQNGASQPDPCLFPGIANFGGNDVLVPDDDHSVRLHL